MQRESSVADAAREERVRRGGRPRSPRADEAILDAGRQLLAEVGYSRMSMDQVARRAGVGKDTLYRRWSSKLVLVRDGILRPAMEAVPVPDTDDPRRDLAVYLTRVDEFGSTTTFGSVVAGMVGEAYRNPELATAFQEFAGSRRKTVEALLRRVLQEQGVDTPPTSRWRSTCCWRRCTTGGWLRADRWTAGCSMPSSLDYCRRRPLQDATTPAGC